MSARYADLRSGVVPDGDEPAAVQPDVGLARARRLLVVVLLVQVAMWWHLAHRPGEAPDPNPKRTVERAMRMHADNELDLEMEIQNDVLQTKQDVPADCTVLMPLLAFFKPQRQNVEHHLRHFACHALTDFADMPGVRHVVVVKEGMEEVLRKYLDIPPHVSFVLYRGIQKQTFDHTTMRMDDDDYISSAYVRLCCSAKARNQVMFPAHPYLYFEDLDIIHRSPMKHSSYGLCVFPNDNNVHAMSDRHVAIVKAPGMRAVYAPMAGYYTRHDGNNSDRKRPDPKQPAYREGVVMRPQCKTYRPPPELVDAVLELWGVPPT